MHLHSRFSGIGYKWSEGRDGVFPKLSVKAGAQVLGLQFSLSRQNGVLQRSLENKVVVCRSLGEFIATTAPYLR